MRFLLALLCLLGLAHAAPTPITWSPTDHSPFVTVSGDTSQRVVGGGAYQSGRSDTAQSVGVRVVRFNIINVGSADGSGPGMMVGVGNGKSILTSYSGSNSEGVSYDAVGRVLKLPYAVSVPSYTTGDLIDMRVDLDAHTVAFAKNGGSYGPTTDISGLGPEVYVTYSLGNGTTSPVVQISDTNWNDFPWTTLNVVAHGDSMTLTGGVQQTYHSRLLSLIEASRSGWAQGLHLGINGASWAFTWSLAGYPYNLTQDAPIRVDTARSASLPNWLVAFAGTNGFALANHTAVTEYNHLKAYVQARIAAGWEPSKIVICTMLPRGGVLQATVDAYNALIVADATGLGYRVARLDLDPRLSTITATYYQPDNTHPTDAGHQAIAEVIYTVMTLYASTAHPIAIASAKNDGMVRTPRRELACTQMYATAQPPKNRAWTTRSAAVRPSTYSSAKAMSANTSRTGSKMIRRNCLSSVLMPAILAGRA